MSNLYISAFNTNAIVFDNTPWRPGRDFNIENKSISEEDERKLKNLATRIMSNGVEVLVKDKEDMKPEQTKYMEVKTIQPSAPSHVFASNLPKIDKRVDNEDLDKFDYIQPSEVSHSCTTTSCSCSHTKTEGLKTKHTHGVHGSHSSVIGKYPMKTTKYGSTVVGFKPTNKENIDKNTQYGPYEYESSSQIAPTDKVVEKYTEVNDYSDEKDNISIEESELLTNEQAPGPPITNVVKEKPKPEKVQKVNHKNKLVGDLLKLGSLSIKGLSQLAPVFEKMTGGFMKKQENNKTTSTTSTVKPAVKLTSYNVNKRVDTDMELKGSQNFPIYIPVDEMEASESQNIFSNGTLHQSLIWAAEHKHPKSHNILPPKMVHESPLVNGGIPISPGEIITANSDVIVGKPAVGGPLTLAASGIKLHNNMRPPSFDSFVSESEQHIVQEVPDYREQSMFSSKVDDSFDLRPPNLPKEKQPMNLPPPSNYEHNKKPKYSNKPPIQYNPHNNHKDNLMKTEHIKTSSSLLGTHGRPAFIDYIPSLGKPNKKEVHSAPHRDFESYNNQKEEEIPDNNPSSSEIQSTRVQSDSEYPLSLPETINKPFLVDIQPSRVANVLIPHGSATALVFAGSSEPHKTGDYVDEQLPYPEPGYFGSFSIDAPQMTNVHVAPNTKPLKNVPSLESYKPKDITFRNDQKQKWKDFKRPIDYNKIPPPTSNIESHVQVGPHITVYNPDSYKGDFEAYNQIKPKYRDDKISIDNEYEKYLAVPPPPQSKVNYKNEQKHYQQLPVVHTKPIQDMKVFLNIQHPVPHQPATQPVSPKVTSEVYYAEQNPNSRPTPTYTVQIPPTVPENNNDRFKNNQPYNNLNIYNNVPSSKLPVSPGKISNAYYANQTIRPISMNNKQANKNTYTVTLNTATNVANNVAEAGQVIGSSVPVSIETTVHHGDDNANIPIGTNFSIKVDDGQSSSDSYSANNESSDIKYIKRPEESEPGGTLNIGEIEHAKLNNEQHEIKQSNTNKNVYHQSADNLHISNEISSSITPSLNSHANFPMINEKPNNIKPEIDTVESTKDNQKRPPKLIPNIPTNSHGWYSSVFKEESLNNLNNIKFDVTTRKNIPLNHDYNKDDVPTFGEKITNVAKPPNDFWSHTIGKPFSKFSDFNKNRYSSNFGPQSTEANTNYLQSNFENIKQPEYEIPNHDNSDEITTTTKTVKSTTIKPKPVYENSEEIYDGEEDFENEEDLDGEVSQESIKVPIITASSEVKDTSSSTEGPKLLQNEILTTDTKQNNIQLVGFDPKTQTEKPFINSTNKFHSNNIKPIYSHNESNTRPRPFTMSNHPTAIDHQLHQPHWQINELMVNSTNMSYEEGLDLNLGEEMSTVASIKITPTPRSPFKHSDLDNKYKRPRPNINRPVNNVHPPNSSNIITSTVHIHDKKPLIVKPIYEKSTLPSFTIKTDSNYNYSSTEILDLSPPPPTMDYNFKPSTNDETIMGMSPPPPRSPPPVRVPPRISQTPKPVRTPPPYRIKPPRTPLPRTTTQRSTKKPLRDEISTYRPAYNHINRPIYNQEQPSPILLPPSSRAPAATSIPERPTSVMPASSIIFPTPVSSGWLTSSGVGFSSSFDFGPTPVYFPDSSESTKQSIPGREDFDIPYSSNENNSSSEHHIPTSSEKSVEKNEVIDNINNFKDSSTETSNIVSTHKATTAKTSTTNIPESGSNEFEQEQSSTEKINVIPLNFKNRTRKPYPLHEKRPSITHKPYVKPVSIIKPVTTANRPEILYPKRPSPTKKIVKPLPTKPTTVSSETLIESSESFVDDDFVKATEVLNKVSQIPVSHVSSASVNPTPYITPEVKIEETSVINKPVHHAGNEIKISDEIIPTKTEFRTTVVTLTKTLSEPPKTVSSIGYVNLTHTLTVTQTETSLVSKSEGAVTETLVITNTQTSTLVDVITEVHTQVQPTTIIETVTKHIPIPQVEPTPVQEVLVTTTTKVPLDDITMSSEEADNFILKEVGTTENVQKIVTEDEGDNDTFFVVMNKSQNGAKAPPPLSPEVETGDYDHITRNEQVNSNGVSQVLFGEILLAGTPYLETSNVHPTGVGFGKECQPDCKASRNERCQRIDGLMKCVCRPGFARMFPDRPCKPTYTYSVRLALGSQGDRRLQYQKNLSDNSSKEYHELALATHEGINRMVMQSDLRDVFHGVHITGFQPIEMKKDNGEKYQGVMNDFYVQLSDNAHESRLKEVLEKYLRNNNYSLGGIDVHAAGEFVDKLEVSDFDECTSGQFHDCSEHAQCFNLRGTYTCSCLEGFADLSVNKLYPGRICSAEPVGCERCNYHGACYSRDDRRVLCECFQWYSGSSCQINLKVVLISLVVIGVLLTIVLAACAVVACSRRPRPSVVTCIQAVPTLHPGSVPGKQQRADRRALITERGESGDAASLQNASLPYMPSAKHRGSRGGVCMLPAPAHDAPPPPPAPAVVIPRARLLAHDSRDNLSRKKSLELSSEAKLISYLESGAAANANEEMRRKHSMESSYSASRDRHNKQGALVSAGFKVSTTIRPDEQMMKEERERDRDDLSSVNKADLEAEISSQDDMSEWTDGERRLGELTLSEARSIGGTLPASTGRAASSTRLTHQEAHTMAERELGSTFLLPHVHLYKPDITSDVSEFDSL